MIPQINISPEEWNAIEDHLDSINLGNSPTEQEGLKHIPDLQQKIEHIKKFREDIEDVIRLSKIKNFHLEEEKNHSEQSGSKKIRLSVLFYSIAAILIVVFGIFWMLNEEGTPEKLFSKNFTPDVGLPLKMGTSESYIFYEGMVDYKQENYEEAISKWLPLLKANPESDTLNYFLGVANLALGHSAESLKFLTNQNRFKGGMFEEDAVYYAALAAIKEGNFDAAKLLLKNNPSPKNTNLLNQLQKQ